MNSFILFYGRAAEPSRFVGSCYHQLIFSKLVLLYNYYYFYYYSHKLPSSETPRHIPFHSKQLSLVTTYTRSTTVKYRVVRPTLNTDFLVARESTVVTIVTYKLQNFDPG